MQAVFWELPSFARWREHYLDDDDYRRLQTELMRNPNAGVVIQGTGGLRKLRFASRHRQKGKRGGLRVIYFWRAAADQFWLFSIYGKNEISDLSPEQRRMLHERLKHELMSGGGIDE